MATLSDSQSYLPAPSLTVTILAWIQIGPAPCAAGYAGAFLKVVFSLWDSETGTLLAGLLLGIAISGLLFAKLTSLDVRAEFDA